MHIKTIDPHVNILIKRQGSLRAKARCLFEDGIKISEWDKITRTRTRGFNSLPQQPAGRVFALSVAQSGPHRRVLRTLYGFLHELSC